MWYFDELITNPATSISLINTNKGGLGKVENVSGWYCSQEVANKSVTMKGFLTEDFKFGITHQWDSDFLQGPMEMVKKFKMGANAITSYAEGVTGSNIKTGDSIVENAYYAPFFKVYNGTTCDPNAQVMFPFFTDALGVDIVAEWMKFVTWCVGEFDTAVRGMFGVQRPPNGFHTPANYTVPRIAGSFDLKVGYSTMVRNLIMENITFTACRITAWNIGNPLWIKADIKLIPAKPYKQDEIIQIFRPKPID